MKKEVFCCLFQLLATRYQELEIIEDRYWFEELELGLGVWQGKYQGFEGLWLRWYDDSGNWIPTLAELAEQEKQRAEQLAQQVEQEKQRAEQEKQRAEQLAERLRELGIDPEQI